MPYSYLVLYDFSPYAQQALRIAHQWSLWTGAELHLLHNMEAAYVPAMAGMEVRQQVEAASKSEVYHKLQQSYKDVTGQPANPINMHVSLTSLYTTTTILVKQYNVQLLFAGLKGHGVLKRFFIGSTMLKLLEHLTVPIAAIPKNLKASDQISLHISVSYHHIFNSGQLQQFVNLMGNKIQAVTFISVLAKSDNRQHAVSYLTKLRNTLSAGATVDTRLFEGDDPFAQVKAYMKDQEDGVLLVQKGSRALSDYLFREFFINELVHDASIPLIILPS